MAVVKWRPLGGEWSHSRNFHPPKRADLKYWYREATKALGERVPVPAWLEAYRLRAFITEELIIFDTDQGELYIARKRSLR